MPCKISEHSTWGKPLLYRHWVSCKISVFSFGCLRIMNEGPPRNFLKSDQNSSFRECFCEPLNKVESVLIPWWWGGGGWGGWSWDGDVGVQGVLAGWKYPTNSF